MEKKKLLFIITQAHWGGAQRYVFDLATSLNNDYDITVACGGEGRLVDALEAKNIRVRRLQYLVRPIQLVADIRALYELFHFMKNEHFDIVHCNSSKVEVIGIFAAWLAQVKKIIFTAHGFVFNEPMQSGRKKFYISLERFMHRFSTNVIAVSDYDKQTALAYSVVPLEKIVTIHNGIDVLSLQGVEQKNVRDVLSLPADAKVVGTVANFYATKGLPYLIEAAVEVVARNKNIYFVVFGDGMLRDQLEALITMHGLGQKFILAGFRDNVVQLYKSFDVFVLPSLKEGLPYTLLEAMALGVPTVATAVGGVPEVITHGKNGYLIRPNNSHELTDTIISVLENGSIEMISEAAKETIIDRFTLEVMVDKTNKIYQQ